MAAADTPIDGTSAVRVGLSWDFFDGCIKTDLDCAALAFDSVTTLVDACYYNQTSILGAAIQHSGDERDGTKEGFDEVITIDLARLPQRVQAIVLIVNAYQGGTLAGDITLSTTRLPPSPRACVARLTCASRRRRRDSACNLSARRQGGRVRHGDLLRENRQGVWHYCCPAAPHQWRRAVGSAV